MSILLLSWVAALSNTVPDKDKCLTQKTYTHASIWMVMYYTILVQDVWPLRCHCIKNGYIDYNVTVCSVFNVRNELKNIIIFFVAWIASAIVGYGLLIVPSSFPDVSFILQALTLYLGFLIFYCVPFGIILIFIFVNRQWATHPRIDKWIDTYFRLGLLLLALLTIFTEVGHQFLELCFEACRSYFKFVESVFNNL